MPRPRRLCVFFSLATLLFVILEQCALLLAPGDRVLLGLSKLLCAGTPAVLALLLWRRSPSRQGGLLVLALAVCTAADVAINLNGLAGMGLFAAGHLCFCLSWLCCARPRRGQVRGFALALGAGGVVLFLLRGAVGALALPALGYMAVIFAMVALSFGLARLKTAGALVFLLSDLMLVGNKFLHGNAFTHALALAAFYAALLLMACSLVPPEAPQLTTQAR